MPTSGDVVDLDLGPPEGREAGFRHPAVLVTAQRTLEAGPSVVHVVPLTSTVRQYDSEVVIQPDGQNGLDAHSCAQPQRSEKRRVRTERVRTLTPPWSP